MNGSTPEKSTIASKCFSVCLTDRPEDRRVEEDVLAAGQIRMEAGPQFEQGSQPTAVFDAARGGLQNPADQLEQRRFAGAVGTDQPDGRPAGDVEIDVPQRPEVFLVRVRPTEIDHPLLEGFLLADDEPLGRVRHLDDCGTHDQISCAKLVCSRAKTRWQSHSATRPTTKLMTMCWPRSAGWGRLEPADPEGTMEGEHGQRDRVRQVQRLHPDRCRCSRRRPTTGRRRARARSRTSGRSRRCRPRRAGRR